MKFPKMLTEKEIELWIIKKLLRHHVMCKHHIDIRDVLKGADPQYYMLIKDVIKTMIKKGYLVKFPHKGKIKVCLNSKMRGIFESMIS